MLFRLLNSKVPLWNFTQKILFDNSFKPNSATFGTRFMSNQYLKKLPKSISNEAKSLNDATCNFILKKGRLTWPKVFVRSGYVSFAALAGYICIPTNAPIDWWNQEQQKFFKGNAKMPPQAFAVMHIEETKTINGVTHKSAMIMFQSMEMADKKSTNEVTRKTMIAKGLLNDQNGEISTNTHALFL